MSQLNSTVLLAQEGDAAAGAAGAGIMILWLAMTVVIVGGLRKTSAQAGKPGWGAIIPIYNIVLLLQIAGRPIWWIILLIIPIVNFIVAIVVALDIARKFGKGAGFGIGLALLGFIFYPILGFGSAQYQADA